MNSRKFNKMFKLSVTILTLFLLCTLFTKTQGAELEPEIGQLKEQTQELAHHRNRRSLIDSLQQIISNAISNLINAADQINSILVGISNTVNEAVKNVMINLDKTIQKLLDDVQNAVDNALAASIGLGVAAVECIRNNQDEATGIANDTIVSVPSCVTDTISNVSGLLDQGAELAANANQMAVTMTNKLTDCLMFNNSDIIQLASCLTVLSVENVPPSVNLVSQISITIANTLLTMGTIPVRVPLCLGSSVANAVIKIGEIVVSIPKCIQDLVSP